MYNIWLIVKYSRLLGIHISKRLGKVELHIIQFFYY